MPMAQFRRDPEPQFDPSLEPSAPERVGDLLARRREELGQDLRTVSEVLRIRFVHLHAIEEGRYDDLPGPTYAIGFVRSYADYLGFEPREIVERFKREVSGLESHQSLHFPVPKPEGRIPGVALILISVLLIALAYGGWTYLSRQDESRFVELLPALTDEPASPAGEPPAVPQPAPQPAPASEALAVDGSTVEMPAVVEMSGDAAASQASTESEPVAEHAPAAPDEAEEEIIETPIEPEERAGESVAREESGPVDAMQGQAQAESETAAVEPPPIPAPIPAPISPSASAPVASAPSVPVTPAPSVEPSAPASTTASISGAAEANPAPSAASAIPAPPRVEAPELAAKGPAPREYGAVNEGARIVLKAVSDSWVQVRDAENALLFTKVLRGGDSYQVPRRDGLTLLTGNAGGLEIYVDGRPTPSIGPLGAVRRNVSLDPERLLAGEAVAGDSE